MNLRSLQGLTAVVLAAALAACADTPTATVGSPDINTASSQGQTGNGMQSGSHYNLNIIGVDKDKTASLKGSSGHRIFVRLYGGQQVCDPDALPGDDLYCDPGDLKGGRSVDGTWAGLDKINKILLTPNSASGVDGFAVLDANATDTDGAEFTMPDNVYGGYTVYARALGKPGGSARITTCADEIYDETTGEIWCSAETAVMTREKKQPKAEDVTEELLSLTITIDLTNDADLAQCLTEGGLNVSPSGEVTVPVFNPCFENYFWNYDNNGLRLLQIRFYRVS
ncbi:MAG: hypothetical protein LJF04_06840 [Gemmatimonadetes bacterium]|nr:hypothetical protein [Gemmatimonadota bacterium]